jgi:hypothetical protein
VAEHHSLAPNQALVTPRAAAIAGIIFSVLMGTIYLLIQSSQPIEAENTHAMMDAQENTISIAFCLVPFAGIAAEDSIYQNFFPGFC